MLFNSFAYLVFLPIVTALYWAAPDRTRRPLLLVASYIFYMSWLPRYGLLIAGMTAVNFLFGRWLTVTRRRKPVLVLALAANLASLAYFKYARFLLGSFAAALVPLGLTLEMGWAERIILPLGISFFTFEFIHYLVDLYRGGKPIRSFVDFALFPAFFPTQIAGPVKRYQDFILQLEALPAWNRDKFQKGLALIVRGMFKKVVLADSLAVTAGMGFGNAYELGTVSAWVAVLAFAFQIYFDFSGYTDIGRGSAQLMGFSVPENFNLPYLATSISEFWRRWHITLSQWLRDYLFIPLGGSRGTRGQTYRNLFITMTLGGLWHGAAWTFVIWGMYHGICLILHREFRRWSERSATLNRLKGQPVGRLLAVLFTFILVCVGWVLFRAQDLDQAGQILLRMFTPAYGWLGTAVTETRMLEVALIVGAYACFLWFSHWLDHQKRWPALDRGRWAITSLVYTGMIAAIIVLPPQVSSAFIYFQF